MLKEKLKKLAPRKKAIAARSVTDRELAVIERRVRARGEQTAMRSLKKKTSGEGTKGKKGRKMR